MTDQTIWPEDGLREQIAKLNAEANQWAIDWGDAQKMIAELEAENASKTALTETLEGQRDYDYKRAEQLEERVRELAALKAQRCEGCKWLEPQSGGWDSVCDSPDSEYWRESVKHPADFACNRWTARAEEGGES
jgi:hypothetical protein